MGEGGGGGRGKVIVTSKSGANAVWELPNSSNLVFHVRASVGGSMGAVLLRVA